MPSPRIYVYSIRGDHHSDSVRRVRRREREGTKGLAVRGVVKLDVSEVKRSGSNQFEEAFPFSFRHVATRRVVVL